MRFILLDRVSEFEPGRRARGIRAVTLGEGLLHAAHPGRIACPEPLVLEMQAQLAGLCAMGAWDWRRQAGLAKVARAEFMGIVRPGDVVEVAADVTMRGVDAAHAVTTAAVADRLVARAELMLAALDMGEEATPPPGLAALLAALGIPGPAADAGGRDDEREAAAAAGTQSALHAEERKERQ